MASPEHVDLVKRGKGAIDEWRAANPWSSLDLRGAEFSRVDLSDADLTAADLSDARFRGAILHRTNFRLAKLIRTDLTDADCRWAKFHMTDLGHAVLRNADFRHANLAEINANGADFELAKFGLTAILYVDFTGAKNLERTEHLHLSSVGTDTVFRSQGRIPASFLLGCGVPKILIEHLPILLSTPNDFYSSFISYSHNDEDFAKKLRSRMQQEHLRVWYAPDDISGGKYLHEQIFDAIGAYDKLLVVLTEHSMDSGWVVTEIRRARERERAEGGKVLFPIRLAPWDKIAAWKCFDADSGKDLAVEIREIYIRDFSEWKDHDKFEAEFAKLLRDLKQSNESKDHK
jgi:hypothetical protein